MDRGLEDKLDDIERLLARIADSLEDNAIDRGLEDRLDDIERLVTRIADSLDVTATATEETAKNTAPSIGDTIAELLWEIKRIVDR